MLAWLGSLAVAMFLTGCGTSNANSDLSTTLSTFSSGPVDLDTYWYQGKAEVTSYDLLQARYSDEHPGDAVMVFVSEDFLTEKQVKNESYSGAPSTKVLKANMLRKFPTGMYDYSIMTSVFTPANTRVYPHTLKVTMSAQDWCGQSFMQINHQDQDFLLQQYSYFEGEADRETSLAGDIWLEDELWTRLRMDPGSMPEGNINILPSLMKLRLLHMANEPLKAVASTEVYKGADFPGTDLMIFEVDYEGSPWQLSIIYESAAPYKIVGWSETSRGGLTTIARKKAELFTDYWAKNSLADSTLRNFLKL